MSIKRRLATVAGGSLLVCVAFLAPAPSQGEPVPAAHAPARSALRCRAQMGDATPGDYTYDRGYVKSVAFTRFHATAHYKTTNTTKYGKTNRYGRGSVPFYISGATPVALSTSTSTSPRTAVRVTAARRSGRTVEAAHWVLRAWTCRDRPRASDCWARRLSSSRGSCFERPLMPVSARVESPYVRGGRGDLGRHSALPGD